MRRLLLPIGLLAVLAIALVLAGCGGEETTAPLPETVAGSIPQETLPQGDAEAGREVFTSTGCGSCHTYGPAGTEASVGPNLDESLKGADPEFIRTAIVNPNAEIAEGFQPNVMPGDYGQQLDDQQLADLVAFLQQQ
jgi:mono/diheme cytochrome c family protein